MGGTRFRGNAVRRAVDVSAETRRVSAAEAMNKGDEDIGR
jgi:hypothetical protein